VNRSAGRARGRRESIVLPGRFRAAVFDLDGLLADSESVWAAAEAAILARHGLPYTPEDALATRGRSVPDSVAVYADRLGLPAARRADLMAALLAEYRARIPSIVALPGATRLIRRLSGRMPLAIASNSPAGVVEETLRTLGLADDFDVTICADAVRTPKPDPEVYVLACLGLGVEPRDTVAFEDSEPGVRAAVAAGLFCVAIAALPGTAGSRPDLSAADLVLGSLEEVEVEAPGPG
jgi:HAD superfamily hydrolase (TIGR01509 family)